MCLELEEGVLLQQLPAELLLAGSVWGRLALRRSVQVVERSNHFDVVAVSDKRGGEWRWKTAGISHIRGEAPRVVVVTVGDIGLQERGCLV